MNNPFETQPLSHQPVADTSKKRLAVDIGSKDGFVVILFDKPIDKLVITKTQAREMIRLISKECMK